MKEFTSYIILFLLVISLFIYSGKKGYAAKNINWDAGSNVEGNRNRNCNPQKNNYFLPSCKPFLIYSKERGPKVNFYFNPLSNHSPPKNVIIRLNNFQLCHHWYRYKLLDLKEFSFIYASAALNYISRSYPLSNKVYFSSFEENALYTSPLQPLQFAERGLKSILFGQQGEQEKNSLVEAFYLSSLVIAKGTDPGKMISSNRILTTNLKKKTGEKFSYNKKLILFQENLSSTPLLQILRNQESYVFSFGFKTHKDESEEPLELTSLEKNRFLSKRIISNFLLKKEVSFF